MIPVPTKTRVISGQILVLVSVIFVAISLGFVPDRQAAIMAGRISVCEVMAIHGSEDIRRRDFLTLEDKLSATLRREREIKSIRLLAASGTRPIELGLLRRRQLEDLSWIEIPIWDGNQLWGELQVGFTPLKPVGLIGWLWNDVTRLVLGIAGVAFLAFYLYLSRVLNYLDPANAVPDRVRSALDALAGGVVVVDRQGQIVLANRAFAASVESLPEQLPGKYLHQLGWHRSSTTPTDSGEPTPTNMPWSPCMKDRVGVQRQTVRFTTPSGVPRTFLIGATAVVGDDGLHRGALIGLEDVTNLERTKEQLREAKEIADAANQAKTRFLAGMSHEIRTPMNAIIGFADALRRGLDESDVERDEYLEIIYRNGKHLLHLINDILDLSKVESGKMELELAHFCPVEILQDVLSVFQRTAADKGLSLVGRVTSRIPKQANNDVGRLRQVLTNVIGNALKFTSEGGIDVRLSVRKDTAGHWLRYEIEDTGIGMTAAAQSRIFDAFTQADATVSRRFGGTGLGLPIARDLTRAMGGELTVTSVEGQGTTFVAEIDLGAISSETWLDPEEANRIKQRNERSSADSQFDAADGLAGRSILVADDGEANRKLVSLLFRRAGARVEQAVNGLEATELANQNDYDVILMDMQMPVMDGYTATQQLRANGKTLPIIALTANAMKGEREKCLDAGCSDFLTKPIDADHMLNLVEETCRANGNPVATTLTATDFDHVEERQADEHQTATPRTRSEAPTVRAEVDETVSVQSLRQQLQAPIRSTLPLDDEEFCTIINDYIGRLGTRLEEMRQALDAGDFETLDNLAHWLKGSGGTAGFDVLTQAATRLETAARAKDFRDSDCCLAEIQGIYARLERAEVTYV